MRNSQSISLTDGPMLPAIIRFSIPLMLSNVLQVLFNMSDIAVVGRFAGARALGAVGSTTILVTLFTGFLIAILFFGRFFDLHSLSLGSWLVFIVFTLLAVPTIRSITILMNKGADLWNKHISPWTQKVREKWNER